VVSGPRSGKPGVVGLPVSPGVSEAREALVKWAKLLEEIVPPS
jgi:hypothetical protein